jgi:NADPH2:quinone reductase
MLPRQGGYAEYAAAPAATTFDIPDGLGDEAALALLIQGLTAWHLYRTSAGLRPGESVVVHSAAGGVGNLAVQLGKPMGAGRVIATASSEEKRQKALELGADAAVDSGAEDLHAALLEANEGRKVDVVFEMAGGAVFLRRVPAGAGAVRAPRDLRDRHPRAERDPLGISDGALEVGRRLLPGALRRAA